MASLLNDWAAIAETDDSVEPIPISTAQHLLTSVVVSGHRGLSVGSRVVKRDPRTGAPHYRRVFSGTWRLRLIGGGAAERRCSGAAVVLRTDAGWLPSAAWAATTPWAADARSCCFHRLRRPKHRRHIDRSPCTAGHGCCPNPV